MEGETKPAPELLLAQLILSAILVFLICHSTYEKEYTVPGYTLVIREGNPFFKTEINRDIPINEVRASYAVLVLLAVSAAYFFTNLLLYVTTKLLKHPILYETILILLQDVVFCVLMFICSIAAVSHPGDRAVKSRETEILIASASYMNTTPLTETRTLLEYSGQLVWNFAQIGNSNKFQFLVAVMAMLSAMCSGTYNVVPVVKNEAYPYAYLPTTMYGQHSVPATPYRYDVRYSPHLYGVPHTVLPHASTVSFAHGYGHVALPITAYAPLPASDAYFQVAYPASARHFIDRHYGQALAHAHSQARVHAHPQNRYHHH